MDALWKDKHDGGELLMFDFSDEMRELFELAQTIKQLQKQSDAIKQRLKTVLGDHCLGCSDRFEISWRPQERTTIDTKKLYREHPEVYRACAVTSTTRVFKMKERESNDSE